MTLTVRDTVVLYIHVHVCALEISLVPRPLRGRVQDVHLLSLEVPDRNSSALFYPTSLAPTEI